MSRRNVAHLDAVLKLECPHGHFLGRVYALETTPQRPRMWLARGGGTFTVPEGEKVRIQCIDCGKRSGRMGDFQLGWDRMMELLEAQMNDHESAFQVATLG